MRHKYTKELLEPIVARSFSWADVCRELEIKPFTGSQSNLTIRAKLLGIDSSHFTGKLWSKGKTLGAKRPIEVYLTDSQSIKINSDSLRRKLFISGLKKKECEVCGISTWLGQELPLHLDHINCNHWDNRIENLQILCPNCHAVKTREDRRSRRSGVKVATRVLEARARKGVRVRVSPPSPDRQSAQD
jgi:5-methylcytosine-specific restriction endonuclease McrA